MKTRESNCNPETRHIFVTGGTGFIGRHLVKSLIEKNYAVTVLSRNPEAASKILNSSNLNIVYFDIKNQEHKLTITPGSTLIHCAWEDVRNTLNKDHIEYFFSHYKFLKNIISLGIKNLIVTGTCYEYGLQYGAMSAIGDTKPNTPYSLAKDCLHKSLRMLQKDTEFNFIWARLFYVYGDGQDGKSITQIFDEALERNDSVFNMSLGEQLLDYLSVEKVAEYLTTLVNYKNGIFNVCKGEPISLRRFLENRMSEKGKFIKLNLGYYDYRKQDSIAIWGDKSFEKQLR